MKKILFGIIILFIGIILGSILLIGVYKLPVKNIESNVKKSITLFEQEGMYPYELVGYENSKLDNFTDLIMLLNASYDGNESTVSKAMHAYRYNTNENPLLSLKNQIAGQKDTSESYERYWHGYLLLLKPLLLLFSYNDLRFINTILQIFLTVSIVYFMAKKEKEKYIIPYLVSLIMICPTAIFKSMQFSTIFYIYNIGILLLLLLNNRLNGKYGFYFLTIGMLTSYFDFLTYPLVTLGMPLIFYFILNEHRKIWDSFKKIAINSVSWGIGYIGMWLGKLIVGSILVGENFFSSALDAFTMRTSNQAFKTNITASDVIQKNMDNLLNFPVRILLLLILAIFVYKLFKNRKQINIDIFIKIIPYLIISIMPFVWYMVTTNHSYIHNFFTYRTLVITFFGLLVSIYNIEANLEEKNEKR